MTLSSMKLPCAWMLLGAISAPASSQVPTTVTTSEPGMWQQDDEHRFELIEELALGVDEGDSNEVFGNIASIAIGASGEIYLLDMGYVRVLKFDAEGNYLQTIGRQGQGPGEFSPHPTALCLDDTGRLFVADRDLVTIFDADGEYESSFRLGMVDEVPKGIRFHAEGGIYVSCFDSYDSKKVLHRYDHNYQRIASFGEAWEPPADAPPSSQGTFAGGNMDMGTDGTIYYSQTVAPYQIRVFTRGGELESVFYRENDFFHEPTIERVGTGWSFGNRGGGMSLVVLPDGKLIHSSYTYDDEDVSSSIIDVFDTSGQLLYTTRYEGIFSIKASDRRGRVYAIDKREFPQVIRYRVATE